MGKKTLKIGSTVCACVLVALVVVMWTGRNTPPANSSPTVSGPRSWPNEPPGFRPVTDQPWNPQPALGWSLAWGQTAVVTDSSAPLSPPNVLEETYPIGFQGGDAPGTQVRSLPSLTSMYLGMWWKASDPWQGHNSNVNKIQFLFPRGKNDITMVMYGVPGGPYELRVIPQFENQPSEWLRPNAKQVPVTLGVWHRIEWLLVYNTTTEPANGICKWWLDGQLVGDYTNVLYPASPMVDYKLSPTWGGVGSAKTENDYFRYDHIYISGR